MSRDRLSSISTPVQPLGRGWDECWLTYAKRRTLAQRPPPGLGLARDLSTTVWRVPPSPSRSSRLSHQLRHIGDNVWYPVTVDPAVFLEPCLLTIAQRVDGIRFKNGSAQNWQLDVELCPYLHGVNSLHPRQVAAKGKVKKAKVWQT
jgi:hypothetical protein